MVTANSVPPRSPVNSHLVRLQPVDTEVNKLSVLFKIYGYLFLCPQSSVRKKKAAVHFTTIPCEPITACKVQGKPHVLQYLVFMCSRHCVRWV